MRIASLTPLYPPSIGGTQILTEQCARYFASAGHVSAVFTSAVRHLDAVNWKVWKTVFPHVPAEKKEGVEIFRYPYGGRASFLSGLTYAAAFRTRRPFLWHGFYRRHQNAFYHAAEMERAISEFRPDVLFVNPFTEYQTDLALSLKRRLKIPAAYHLSLHIEKHLFPRRELKRLLEFDAVMTNTAHEKAYLLELGLDPGRVHVTGATFDVDAYLKDEKPEREVVDRLAGKPFVLYFGRREHGKGANGLIEAFEKVSPDFPEALLVLAGRSTAHFDAHHKERALCHPKIVLWDALSEGSKKWLYAHALCYSMVSKIDSFGLVYFEAWFQGCPVIGADVGAMRGVIDDGIDGRLVPYGDAQALAGVLREFLKNPEQAKRMGETGRAKAHRLLGNHAVEDHILRLLSQSFKEFSAPSSGQAKGSSVF